MDKGYEQKYHSIEEHHWWYVSRRNTVVSLADQFPRNIRILDIGCSGGLGILALKKVGFTDVSGIDFSTEGIEQCRKKGLDKVYVMDAHYPDFKDEEFDLIIASDCLEHLEHDEVALGNWKRILKKGGTGIIFVPAFMSLWSEHDVVNQHFRRYTKNELAEKSKRAGFQVVKSSYWNFSLFFPTYLFRKIRNMVSKPQNAAQDHMKMGNPVAGKVLTGLLSFENLIFKATGLPLGVSTMVVVKRP